MLRNRTKIVQGNIYILSDSICRMAHVIKGRLLNVSKSWSSIEQDEPAWQVT